MWRTGRGVQIVGACSNNIDFEVYNEEISRWRYTGYYDCPERIEPSIMGYVEGFSS